MYDEETKCFCEIKESKDIEPPLISFFSVLLSLKLMIFCRKADSKEREARHVTLH